MSQTDQWAVVIGCSSGVGRATALRVAERLGLNVFGAHRNNWAAQAEQTQGDIRGLGLRAEFFIGDVGTPEGVAAGARALAEVAPPRSVRLFVHSIANASLGCFLPGGKGVYRQFIPKNFQKTLDTMANSFPWWAQQLVEHDLLAPGARLFGLTNPVMESFLVNFGLIAAAKAALEVYIKQLAMEMGPRGFRVNLIKFGLVETLAAEMGLDRRVAQFKRLTRAAIPAGRILTADEVARLIVLLAGDDAEWFNGATIDFSGGQMAYILDATLRLGENT